MTPEDALKRQELTAGVRAEQALGTQRLTAAAENQARTGLINAQKDAEGKGKWADVDLYDNRGNKYTAKSPQQAEAYEKLGLTMLNPKTGSSEEQIAEYDRNKAAFAMQAAPLGLSENYETGDISGTVKREDFEKIQSMADHYGLTLMTQGGQQIDTNGMWPFGDVPAAAVQVMPYGTKPYADQGSMAELAEIEKESQEMPKPDDDQGKSEEKYAKTPAMGGGEMDLSQYTNIKEVKGYVWGEGPDGQTRRLFKVEKPTTQYGAKVYKNPKYEEFQEKMAMLKSAKSGLLTSNPFGR